MTMSTASDHRLWPAPTSNWSMAQVWHDLAFLHWPIPAASLRTLVPEELELDLWDGTAWVGVVPFRMTGIRPRGLPAVPWLSAFLELNVRTYVRRDTKPGVFFFSLDAANPLAVEIARTWYHLPYYRAKMRLETVGDEYHYSSHRSDGRCTEGDFVAPYRPIGPVFLAEKGTFDYWLTERYCLYTLGRDSRVCRAEIDHPPWPLQPAKVELRVNTMGQSHGIRLPDVPPLVHFARRQDVVVWSLTPV